MSTETVLNDSWKIIIWKSVVKSGNIFVLSL